jgi:hypothetical protein
MTAPNRREDIAINLVRTLENIRDPKPPFVSREPVTPTKLSVQQLPAIVVTTGSEERLDMTQTSTTSGRLRRGLITFTLDCYTKGQPVDTAINLLIEAIEEAVESDRTLGGVCDSIQITEINADSGREPPLGEFAVSVVAQYTYRKGNQ